MPKQRKSMLMFGAEPIGAIDLFADEAQLTDADVKILAYTGYDRVDPAIRDEMMREVALGKRKVAGTFLYVGYLIQKYRDHIPHGEVEEFYRLEFGVDRSQANGLIRAYREFGQDRVDDAILIGKTNVLLLSGNNVAEETRDKVINEARATGKAPSTKAVRQAIKEQDDKEDEGGDWKPVHYVHKITFELDAPIDDFLRGLIVTNITDLVGKISVSVDITES